MINNLNMFFCVFLKFVLLMFTLRRLMLFLIFSYIEIANSLGFNWLFTHFQVVLVARLLIIKTYHLSSKYNALFEYFNGQSNIKYQFLSYINDTEFKV